MSQMVGGRDLIFEVSRQGFDIHVVLDAVADHWPDGYFQDADDEAVQPLSAVLAGRAAGASREFFVYRDRESAETWVRDGWTEEHGNHMLHVLTADPAGRPDVVQVTIVIGSVTAETLRLLTGAADALDRMANGGRAARPRRVDWDAALRAAGFTAGREQFYAEVERLHEVLYPGWTADELACHPHEALQFCKTVRTVVALVPDHLVMKALMNRRRGQSKRRPA